MNHSRHLLKVLFASVLIAGSVAFAADAPPSNILFWNSGGGTEYVKSPAKWGNGDFNVDRRVRFDTLETLQVTTRNLREGVRFDLKQPLDLAPYLDNGFLRLRVQFGSGQSFNRGRNMDPEDFPPGSFGRRGDMPLMQPHLQDAAQILPPFGGAPGRAPVARSFSQRSPRVTTEIDHLQLTLVLEKGIMSTIIDIPKTQGSGTMVDTRKAGADNSGWMLFAVPLKSLQSTPGATGKLQRVILTSDNEGTYNLSQLAIVTATDKMTVSIRREGDPIGTQQAEFTVKPGRLTLVADVEAGDSDPVVTWKFDADRIMTPILNGNQPGPAIGAEFDVPAMDPGFYGPDDGPEDYPYMPEDEPYMPEDEPQIPNNESVDARGLVVTHNYPNQEQNYRVEVTVHDRAGKHPDVKTSVMIKVRNGN